MPTESEGTGSGSLQMRRPREELAATSNLTTERQSTGKAEPDPSRRHTGVGQHTMAGCGNRHKLGDGKFLLDVRKRSFTVRLIERWNRCPEKPQSLHPWRYTDLTWTKSPRAQELHCSGWDQTPPQVPSYLHVL